LFFINCLSVCQPISVFLSLFLSESIVIKDAGIIQEVHKNVELFCPTVFKRFVLWIRFVTQFSKDSTNPTNPKNPHKSLLLYTSWIRLNLLDSNSRILWCSKDSFRGFVLSYSVQKIRFVDSFCPTVLKRFISWICFGETRIPNYLICLILEGFVFDSCILNFVLI
jgi:hypothetical protein